MNKISSNTGIPVDEDITAVLDNLLHLVLHLLFLCQLQFRNFGHCIHTHT